MKYSVIIPVYNRPDEVEELLLSLTKQSLKTFELIIIEDGSTLTCKDVLDRFSDELEISYHFKENSGPGDSRNVGMAMAEGDYLIFFDSDCLIPKDYFKIIDAYLSKNELACFGGPDSADSSFSEVQKAINYAMTSTITTGGVRGKKSKLDNFQPRSFNMGIRKDVYEKVGGFSDIHPGEDPDLSYRIMEAGYKTGLIEEAFVYHKRRIDFSKFIKQVYKFGVVRPILMKWYPKHSKLVYWFPSLFLSSSIALMLGFIGSNLFMIPFVVLSSLLFVDSLMRVKSLPISIMAVAASYIQLYSYGYGFLKSAFFILLLKKDERKTFPDFFFKK